MNLMSWVYDTNVLMGPYLHGVQELPFLALGLCQVVSHSGLDTAIPKREYVEACRSNRRAVQCVHLWVVSVIRFRYGGERDKLWESGKKPRLCRQTEYKQTKL